MTLTEQWKKGELEKTFYYIKYNDDSIRTDLSLGKANGLDFCNSKEVKEVLAPVPSYEEWQRIFHYAGKYEHEYTSCVMDYENLKEENQQLKELLKECKHIMNIEKDFASCHFEKHKLNELLTKIDNAIGE